MARSRSIVIAGAGIGGLTAALALSRAGFRPVVLEQSGRLLSIFSLYAALPAMWLLLARWRFSALVRICALAASSNDCASTG